MLPYELSFMSVWAHTLQMSDINCLCSSCTLWCNKSQNCGPWSQTLPKGKSSAQRQGCGGAQEDRGSLLPSSWHILVLSWLWQAPNPLTGVIRPWQAWPLSDCSSHWQADWLTAHARPTSHLPTYPLSETYSAFIYLHQNTPTLSSTACRNADGCVPITM